MNSISGSPPAGPSTYRVQPKTLFQQESPSEEANFHQPSSLSPSSVSQPQGSAPIASTRINAIAMLKRAASQREVKVIGGAATTPGTGRNLDLPASEPSSAVGLQIADAHLMTTPPSKLDSRTYLASPSTPSHVACGPSPLRMLETGQGYLSGTSSPVQGISLSRSGSASRADANRSPLPSLEQLRSRILQERLTAGLQRSARAGAASAASAAARAYAMNKLLGHDPGRDGATSPVSDSGGKISDIDEEGEAYDDEDDDYNGHPSTSGSANGRSSQRGMGSIYLRPPTFSTSVNTRHLLRRSRTISGMSQRAEEERKAAFAQGLDSASEGQPLSPGGIKKKRMSRLPHRRELAAAARYPEPQVPSLQHSGIFVSQTPSMPIVAVTSDNDTAKIKDLKGEEVHPGLTRQTSQREVARTQMMRKLSGRRLGGPSPVPSPDTPHLQRSDSGKGWGANGTATGDAGRAEDQVEMDASFAMDKDSDASQDQYLQLPHTPVKVPAMGKLANTGAKDTDLTPQQQLAFIQMQQVLQQQQLQLSSVQGQFASPSHEQTAFPSALQRTVPQTPQTNSQLGSTSYGSDLRSVGQSWDSPTGANLIPPMHLVGEAALSSDRFAQLSPSKHTAVRPGDERRGSRGGLSGSRIMQDWPTSPTSSSAGYGESVNSRLNSLDEERARDLDEAGEDADDSGGTKLGPGTEHLSLDVSMANSMTPGMPRQPIVHSETAGMETQRLLLPPRRSSSRRGPGSDRSESTFTRNDSMRVSHATSVGDGDHFAYESALVAGQSTSTLGIFPSPGETLHVVGREMLGRSASPSVAPAVQNTSSPHQLQEGQQRADDDAPSLRYPASGTLAREKAMAAIAAGRTHVAGKANRQRLDKLDLERPPAQAGSQEPQSSAVSPDATTPSAELNDSERMLAWKRWMKAQGLSADEGDDDTPASRSATPKKDANLPKLDLKPSPPSRYQGKPTESDAAHSGPALLREKRVEYDLSLSPTLMKELQLDLEWPGRDLGLGLDASRDKSRPSTKQGADTPSNLLTPLGFVRQPNGSFFREEDCVHSPPPQSVISPAHATQTRVQRSGSARRKAPPALNAEESKALQATSVDTGKSSDRSPPFTPLESSVENSNVGASASAQSISDHAPHSKPDLIHAQSSATSQAGKHAGPYSAGGGTWLPSSISTSSRALSPPYSAGALTSHQRQRPPPTAWPLTGTQRPRTQEEGYKTRHHRVPSATDMETGSAYTNDKLMPFPGLLRNHSSAGVYNSGSNVPSSAEDSTGARSVSASTVHSPPVVTSSLQRSGTSTGASSRANSPFGTIPRFHKSSRSLAQTVTPWTPPTTAVQPSEGSRGKSPTSAPGTLRSHNFPETEQSRSASPQVGLFGSLRRKASNAMRKGSIRSRKTPEPGFPEATNQDNLGKAQEGSPSNSISGLSPETGPIAMGSQTSLIRTKSSNRKGAAQQAAPSPSPILAEHGGVAIAQKLPGARLQTFNRFDVSTTGQNGQTRANPIVLKPEPVSSTTRGVVATAPTTQPSVQPRIQIHSRDTSINSVSSNHQNEHRMGPSRDNQALPMGEESLDSGFAAPRPVGLLPANETSGLEPKAAAMLHRYSRILTSSTKTDLKSREMPPGLTPLDIESPPRKLLQVSPVFQIVSSSTIKDRFLILFNDILVVAKPLSSSSGAPGQDKENVNDLPDIRWKFVVKNIMELRHCTLTVSKEQRSRPTPHPLQQVFVDAFAKNAEEAVTDIINRSGLPNRPATIAQLLMQTPEIDRAALTAYLCSHQRRDVLHAFVKLQKVVGVSIESALRMVLMELRFPRDPAAFEALLTAFAAHWVTENKGLIKRNFSEELATDLSFAIMALNDAMHGSRPEGVEDMVSPIEPDYEAPGIFSETMPTLTQGAFLAAFREHDPTMILSDRTLQRIYVSVCAEPIQEGLDRSEVSVRKAVRVHGAGLPLRLTYGVPSEPVIVSISAVDPEFSLRLYGADLIFNPPILSFAEETTRSFTITSKALGVRQAVFVRSGKSARFYFGSVLASDATPALKAAAAKGEVTDLPRAAALMVERAFMRNNFTLALAVPPSATDHSHSSSSPAQATKTTRKFMFSVDDAALKEKWSKKLQGAIEESQRKRSRIQEELSGSKGSEVAESAKATRAANAMALHVLRQALISPNSLASTSGAGAVGPDGLQRSATTSMSTPRSASGNEVLGGAGGRLNPPGANVNLVRNNTYTPGDVAPRNLPSSLTVAQQALDRNASVSRHYYAPQTGAGRAERDLLGLPPSRGSEMEGKFRSEPSPASSAIDLPLPGIGSDGARGGGGGGQGGTDAASNLLLRSQLRREVGEAIQLGGNHPDSSEGISGEELITICTQNSLLPIVLQRRGSQRGSGDANGGEGGGVGGRI